MKLENRIEPSRRLYLYEASCYNCLAIKPPNSMEITHADGCHLTSWHYSSDEGWFCAAPVRGYSDTEILDWLEKKVRENGNWVYMDAVGTLDGPDQTSCPFRVETNREELEEWGDDLRDALKVAMQEDEEPRGARWEREKQERLRMIATRLR